MARLKEPVECFDHRFSVRTEAPKRAEGSIGSRFRRYEWVNASSLPARARVRVAAPRARSSPPSEAASYSALVSATVPDERDLAELAYSLSLRTLSQQEGVLNELRARTGTLLAAAALVASFLGGTVINRDGFDVWTALALVSLVVSIGFATGVLLPRGKMIFSLRGSALYEQEASDEVLIAETYRRLAYWLEGFRDVNEPEIARLFRFYQLSVFALLAEVAFWCIQLALS